MGQVAQNWFAICESLKGVGVLPEEIAIVGVTKNQPIERIRESVEAGCKILAVNYAQDGMSLKESFRDYQGEWHFIGHIQSRKVKFLPTYDCIQSLDRLSVAESLNKWLQASNQPQRVFVEINVGLEQGKSGIMGGELESFLNSVHLLSGLRLDGLMAMPPALGTARERVPYFKKMRGFFERFRTEYGLQYLSMGTSEDFVEAVQEGSNMIRLGTVLYGSR